MNNFGKNLKMGKLFSFMKVFFSTFKYQRILEESATLTFVTLMGFIPFAIFIIFLIPELPFIKFEGQLQTILIKNFLPESVDQISNYIIELLNQRASFSLFNFLMLLITSYSLFQTISGTFDKILNVHELREKDILYNIVKFLGMIVLGFILLLILFSATSLPIISNLFNIGFLQHIMYKIVPIFLLFFFILFVYFFIPTIKIKRFSLIIGAAGSSIIWITIKFFFEIYINNLTNMKVIYGVLASFPIFLFWIYINWIIVLSGIVIVSILEKRNIILGDKKEKNYINVSFTKVLGNKAKNSISQDFSKTDLKNILKDILDE